MFGPKPILLEPADDSNSPMAIGKDLQKSFVSFMPSAKNQKEDDEPSQHLSGSLNVCFGINDASQQVQIAEQRPDYEADDELAMQVIRKIEARNEDLDMDFLRP